MAVRNVKVAIIGCGWIAENVHIPTLKLNKEAHLVGVYDINYKKALEIKDKFQLESAFNDYNSLLKSDIDAVIITTPNYTHADFSIQALENGKHVLCEKPVALNTKEMDRVLEAAIKNERIYLPGFVSRFRSDVQKINSIINNGDIGHICSIEGGWIRRCGVPRPGTWFTSSEHSGGGVLIDLGSHIIDIGLMFLGNTTSIKTTEFLKWSDNINQKAADWFGGNTVNSVFQDVESSAIGKVQFENQKVLTVVLSWAANISNDCTYFFIKGTKGRVELRTLFGFSNNKLWDKAKITTISKGQVVEEVLESGNYANVAFDNMLNYFLKKVQSNGVDNYLTPGDGLNTVQVIEELYNTKHLDTSLKKYFNQWELL